MINILVSTDDNYVMPTCVLLESIFDNQNEEIGVYLLWSNLSSTSIETINKIANGKRKNIHFIKIDDGIFAELKTKDYISKETYFRLMASKYLPKDMERILWLDSDMIIRGDISKLYNMNFDGNAVIACPHGNAMKATIDVNCKNIGIKYREQYFNAGMMLCNLCKWKQMDIEQKIREISSKKLKMEFPGQDLTNLVFNGSVKCVDFIKYNCMIHSLDCENLLNKAKAEALIVHFVGRAKPWMFNDLYFADEFRKYYSKTPYGDIVLKTTSYFQIKKMFDKVHKKMGNM